MTAYCVRVLFYVDADSKEEAVELVQKDYEALLAIPRAQAVAGMELPISSDSDNVWEAG